MYSRPRDFPRRADRAGRFILYFSVERMTRRLGVHASIAGGHHLALARAHALGCTTMQIFTHNPRAWASSPISARGASHFRELRRQLDISPVFSHASYLINIASPDRGLRRKSERLLSEEMARADVLGADYVVLHAGIAYDRGGIRRAAGVLRRVLGRGAFRCGLLLENTAGKKGDIASGIGELAEVMDAAGGLAAGICVDSCHAYAAGYDLGSEKGLGALHAEIRKHVGTENFRLIHLNDSKGALGSHVDRHEHIGRGALGRAALKRFITFGPFSHIPIILETPKEKEGDDRANLLAVRRMLSGRR